MNRPALSALAALDQDELIRVKVGDLRDLIESEMELMRRCARMAERRPLEVHRADAQVIPLASRRPV